MKLIFKVGSNLNFMYKVNIITIIELPEIRIEIRGVPVRANRHSYQIVSR